MTEVTLYRFQVYNSTLHHLYIVLCVHHPKSRLLPSPFIPLYSLLPPPPPFSLVITILLSVPMRIFFNLLNPCTFFTQPLQFPFPLTALSLFSESTSLFLFCLFIVFISHINEITWYLSFPDWLISLSIMLSRSIHAVTEDKISLVFTAE